MVQRTHLLGGVSGICVPVTQSWPGFMKCCTGITSGLYLALIKAQRLSASA